VAVAIFAEGALGRNLTLKEYARRSMLLIAIARKEHFDQISEV
jgi:hypothetical protein